MAILEDWRIITNQDGYKAPEQVKYYLQGTVYNHQKFEDGDPITTSYIVGRDGDKILTRSGSAYSLGSINEDYQLWLDENKPGWTVLDLFPAEKGDNNND